MRCLNSIVLSLFLLSTTSSVEAGIIATFTPDGAAFTPSAISVGQTIDVPLYLWYDGTGVNFLNTPGLLSAGIGIDFAPTGILNATFPGYGAGWDDTLSANLVDNAAGFASLQTTVDFFDPPVTDNGTNAILLGLFRFTGLAAGNVVLTLTDADLGLDDTVDDNGLVLDGDILFGGWADITVNPAAAAVPEPSCGILFLMGAGVLAWRRRRHIELSV